jgi:hypothetical protein
MQCPINSLGIESYWAALAVGVGALLRGAKRLPIIRADWVPALAFAIGWGIDLGIRLGLCAEPASAAALHALAGGLAGTFSVGGHETLLRTARALGLGPVAERLLGRAEAQQSALKAKSAAKKAGGASMVLVALLSLGGCQYLPSIIAGAMQGSAVLGASLDAAEAGSRSYFLRHPNPETEGDIAAELLKARLAKQALDAALRGAKAADDGEVAGAQLEALNAYTALWKLLQATGVLDSRAPEGGAETNAPEPSPVMLPSPEQMRQSLR